MYETGERWQGNGADSFVPHSFQTKQLFINPLPQPRIFISPDAYADMQTLAELSGGDEIGWLGTVTELGGARYLIEKIFLVAQDVHGATTELNEDGIGELFTELATSDFEACEHMHFWGHVHPGGSTSPSGQDESQMSLFSHNDFFIRGIFGRNGRAEFTFFDYKSGVRWNDVPWQIFCPVDEARKVRWADEVSDKVSKIITHTPVYGFGGSHHPFGQGSNQTRKVTKISKAGKSRTRKVRAQKKKQKKEVVANG